MEGDAENEYETYQVVELELEEGGQLIERLIACPFATVGEAVRLIRTLTSRAKSSGYDEDDGSWWIHDADSGGRKQFIIREV
jgi:hypothetical protein